MYICLFSLLTAKFAIDHQSIFLMREVSSGESIIGEFKCTVFPIQMYKKV